MTLKTGSMQSLNRWANQGPVSSPDHLKERLNNKELGADKLKGSSFDQLLIKELDKNKETPQLKISAHAESRMLERGIELGTEKMMQLSQAVSKAEGKGAKDSLVLMDGSAFIVNIPNKVVVTALDKENMQGNVFTNIDSTVVV